MLINFVDATNNDNHYTNKAATLNEWNNARVRSGDGRVASDTDRRGVCDWNSVTDGTVAVDDHPDCLSLHVSPAAQDELSALADTP